jgi:hypothetical protein
MIYSALKNVTIDPIPSNTLRITPSLFCQPLAGSRYKQTTRPSRIPTGTHSKRKEANQYGSPRLERSISPWNLEQTVQA